jgi:hypothetical protein
MALSAEEEYGARVHVVRPNVTDHRPRATGARYGTAALSRGSVHPFCSALASRLIVWLRSSRYSASW